MKRREFLIAAGAAGAVAAESSVSAQPIGAGNPRQYYEWRTYRLAAVDKQTAVSHYLEHAALPAWRRMGLGPVGVFTETGASASPSIHVLLVYPTIEQFAGARVGLEADTQYKAAAAEYLAALKESPAFERIDSWFMAAFSAAPQVTVPSFTGKDRVYELRTYDSHSEERARAKIEMFNHGEMPIFVKCGFEPVFYGETLVGSGLPALKYMLAAPDMAANDAGWKKFIDHPDWLAMRDLPQYADTVSNITKLFLKPTAYSQV